MLLLKVNVVIIEYDWVCLNKQCSEYAWGPKRAKILNMAKFQGMNSRGGGGGGAREVQKFLFWWGSNFVGEGGSRNFEVKIKTVQYQYK